MFRRVQAIDINFVCIQSDECFASRHDDVSVFADVVIAFILEIGLGEDTDDWPSSVG
jgi:hypothetical protein